MKMNNYTVRLLVDVDVTAAGEGAAIEMATHDVTFGTDVSAVSLVDVSADGLPDINGRQTNGDTIRAMTNDELAQYTAAIFADGYECAAADITKHRAAVAAGAQDFYKKYMDTDENDDI